MTPDDAAGAAGLSDQLGYAADVATMRRRIEDIATLDDHAAFVACRGTTIVGWVHAMTARHLQSDERAEIGGLVVAADARGSGIGAALVAQCETWARSRGLPEVLVRSQVMRDAAHRFYRREGYTQTKTSVVFSKRL
jgi:GNAT superfamily N-acetyltransferase